MFLARLFRWRDTSVAGLLLGLDAAGKTTLLYHLKNCDIVTTIPTIGFIVETAQNSEWRLACWDVGGCDKIRPRIGAYFDNRQFLIFVHDCSDSMRLNESLEELGVCVEELIKKNGKHVFIMLNKQDLLAFHERDELVKNIQASFEKLLSKFADDIVSEVMDLPGLSFRSGVQLESGLSRIKTIVSGKESKTKFTKVSPTLPIVQAEPTTKQLLEQIEHLARDSQNANIFWESFLSGELPVWNHYNHLQAGYFVILNQLRDGLDIFDYADEFMKHLQRLHESNPGRFRNTTHRTITVFWLIQLTAAAEKYCSTINCSLGDLKREQFSNILTHSPELMNTGLWKQYYSKEVLFTPTAKAEWCQPDLQDVPGISTAGRLTKVEG